MYNMNKLNKLSIFGGTPVFQHKLHVGCPNIGNRSRLLSRISDMMDRRCLTNNGLYVSEFEAKITELLGTRHCIATCNGTLALEIAIRAAELTGEVIIPSFTFVATAHALQWQGITPIFCDVNPRTHNIDAGQIEALITARTAGIIGVHLWGRPCDVESLTAIAQRHKLKLLFDAAHAFGCSYQGRMIGNFGDAEIFSFHATKFFNTFEGGAVVTNNEDLASKIRLMRNFGFSGYDNVISIGINAKMSEVAAAMGLTGLESLDEFISTNYRNYKQYQHELEGIPGVQLLQYNEAEKCNYQYIVLEIDENLTKVSRDQFIEILHAENVLARRYYYPGCHNMMPYRQDAINCGLKLSETERLAKRVLTLPTGTAIGLSDIINICQIIRLVVTRGAEVRRKFEYRMTKRGRTKAN
ncbi:MAG: aminotransferase class I/II-fold pyridoxal phosphate-dependent enzyme [Thermodesulfobacteriota bacterium]